MSRRNLAAKGKADANQPAIARAIEAIGYPVMDLSAAGNGVEDLLVGLYRLYERRNHWWLMVECKVPPIRYKPAQLAWRELTQGWPRITVVSAQDAVDQIRELTR